MSHAIDLTGRVFGQLTVICRAGSHPKTAAAMWLCRCSCGVDKSLPSPWLLHSQVQSCRACAGRKTAARKTTHGGSATRIYHTWHSMMRRCYDQKHPSFRNYGGRGIIVCDRWKSFTTFRDDMAPRPHGLSLDRVDTFGIYEPRNCRWASRRQQSRNTRVTRRFFDLDGNHLTLVDISRHLAINNGSLWRLMVRAGILQRRAPEAI